RRLERDAHGRLGPELLNEGLIGLRGALLGQQRTDWLPRLFELRALHPRLVGGVPRKDVCFGHGSVLRRAPRVDERPRTPPARPCFIRDQTLAHDTVDGCPPRLV